MKRSDVTELVQEKLDRLGVPSHCAGIKKIPSSLEVSVVVGGSVLTKKLRIGITRPELQVALEAIEQFVNERTGTVDLEEKLGVEA